MLANQGLRAQTFSDDNFVYTVAPKKPVQSGNFNTLIKDEMSQNVTYFDGLGRPIQTITIGQGANGEDIITPMEYDPFGRQEKEYLPYVSSNGGSSYPKIDPAAAIAATISFYSTEKYENTANPFSQKQYELSPLNRVLKQAAPGTSWAMGSGHEIKLDYQTNKSSDAVKLYKANTTWLAGSGLYEISFSDAGTYAENELYKNVTFDENSGASLNESSGSTVEFKNKEGQVVLKRTYDSGDKHDTYYVYDIYGNLTYVLPPKVTGAINDDVLNGLCYQYKYDNRNRLVEKKLPGKQWEFIVYDKLDRPVATGPAFSPFKDENTEGWLITKYDAFSRPIYTGWYSQSSNSVIRKSLQDAQNLATVLFETKQTSGTIDEIPANYSNVIAPTSFRLLTVNYYDNYDYPNAPSIPTTIEDQDVLANAKGLATGSWTRVLTTTLAKLGETTTTIYDDKGRPIRTRTQNHFNGYTSTDSKLDFTGKAIFTITRHKRTSGDTELIVREEFTYSPQDRLLTHTHQINGGAVQLLAANKYDPLGQLESKNVGDSSGNARQNVDFSYNIRGWLTGINNIENLEDSDAKDLFAFKINYNNQPGNSAVDALYNGNIAETFWKTASDYSLRSYGYQYDDLNRLKNAIYRKPNDAIPDSGAYNESLDYDKNGNIKSLQRYGDSDAPGIVFKIDELAYGYEDENSNRLAKVTEGLGGNDHKGFIDGNKIGDDYMYDANGNMTVDKNKNITKIDYNYLNLPKKITFGTTGTIEYIYNAAGQKLEKIVTDNTVVTNTNYLGGFQYKDNVLQFFPTAEGYVKNDSGVLSYVFQYKDHLGNVRVSYAKNPVTQVLEITEENNYYPFGLKHSGYNDYLPITNKYKYNGKELQDELGLSMYDMDARQYDPAIARWVVHDPIVHYSHSPYSAFYGNPIYWADPSGMAGARYNWNTGGYENGSGQSISFSEAMGSYGLNTDGSKKNGSSDSPAEITTETANTNINPKDAFGYEDKYPRTMQVLRQLRAHVKSNPQILKKLSEWSGYSTMEVLEKLKYSNSSVVMEIRELRTLHSWNPYALNNGSSAFRLNIEEAEALEFFKSNDALQEYSFFVAMTILHELVHVGRKANKMDIGGQELEEQGWGWEEDALGKRINMDTYQELYKKSNWKFKDYDYRKYKAPPLF